MKKSVAIFLSIFLFLCGCSKENSALDRAIHFRQMLQSAKQSKFECTVTADYGDVIHSFGIACEFDEKGSMSFQVLEPEGISGITGKIQAGSGVLTFDENALAFPLLADGYISPVSAPWVLMKALRGGYIDACGENGDGYCLLLDDSYEESALQITLYTDSEFVPYRAELMWQGKRILSLDVRNFSCM